MSQELNANLLDAATSVVGELGIMAVHAEKRGHFAAADHYRRLAAVLMRPLVGIYRPDGPPFPPANEGRAAA